MITKIELVRNNKIWSTFHLWSCPSSSDYLIVNIVFSISDDITLAMK
jgi:hypothetical protein